MQMAQLMAKHLVHLSAWTMALQKVKEMVSLMEMHLECLLAGSMAMRTAQLMERHSVHLLAEMTVFPTDLLMGLHLVHLMGKTMEMQMALLTEMNFLSPSDEMMASKKAKQLALLTEIHSVY